MILNQLVIFFRIMVWGFFSMQIIFGGDKAINNVFPIDFIYVLKRLEQFFEQNIA